jgi:hypothetical protein
MTRRIYLPFQIRDTQAALMYTARNSAILYARRRPSSISPAESPAHRRRDPQAAGRLPALRLKKGRSQGDTPQEAGDRAALAMHLLPPRLHAVAARAAFEAAFKLVQREQRTARPHKRFTSSSIVVLH